MKRIICVGNPLAADDAAGVEVLRRLVGRPLPAEVELVDGGVGGLDLLGLLEGSTAVVLVDALRGVAGAGETVVLDGDEVAAWADPSCGHGAGIPYLLRVLRQVSTREAPRVKVVGLEPPWSEEQLDHAADLAVSLAIDGRRSGASS